MALKILGRTKSALDTQRAVTCPVCKKEVRTVGDGDDERYATHGDQKTGIRCSKSLVRISWDEK